MQTKTIDKLEDSKGYKWTYNGKDFILNCCNDGWILIQKNCIDFKGEVRNFPLMTITLKNLTELEFYGLKVILNEKPKLTSGEKYIIECIDGEIWLARNKDGSIMMFSENPEVFKMTWSVDIEHSLIPLNPELFKFITWESGKAWSRAELMELEVVE